MTGSIATPPSDSLETSGAVHTVSPSRFFLGAADATNASSSAAPSTSAKGGAIHSTGTRYGRRAGRGKRGRRVIALILGERDLGLLDARVRGAARTRARVIDRLVVGRADVRDRGGDERRAVHRARARGLVVRAALRAVVHHLLIREREDRL